MRKALAPARRGEPARDRPRRARPPRRERPDGRRRVASTAGSRTRCGSRSCRRCRSPCSARASSSWLAAAGGRVVAELGRGARPGLPRIWLKRDVEIRRRRARRRAPAAGGHRRRAAPLAAACPSRSRSVVATREELTLVLRSGLELRLGDGTDLRRQARGRAARPAPARRRDAATSTSAFRSGRSPAKPSTLRSRLRLRPRPCLEIRIDRADKETYPARGKERRHPDALLELQVERRRD